MKMFKNLASHKSTWAEIYVSPVFPINDIKNKIFNTHWGILYPSQINVLNLTVNFSDANKDHKVFVIGGY